LNAPETHEYLTALHRVKPDVANRLHKRADGASNEELAALIPETQSIGVEQDVKHFEKILQMSKRGLSPLSSKASKK
ncbi:MAG: hypothetical protein HRT88_12185, partial [Lentisphaeraceae bacterium]|nr:hypothetical protein [Lentisphaeraceae bacterium]